MSGITFGSEPAAPSQVSEIRAKLETGFTQLAQLISAARAPLPNQTGDGTELALQQDPPELIQKINDTLSDLSHLGITNIETLIQVSEKAKTGAPWNDKQYLMERLIMVRSQELLI